jgi:hypothetical protein
MCRHCLQHRLPFIAAPTDADGRRIAQGNSFVASAISDDVAPLIWRLWWPPRCLHRRHRITRGEDDELELVEADLGKRRRRGLGQRHVVGQCLRRVVGSRAELSDGCRLSVGVRRVHGIRGARGRMPERDNSWRKKLETKGSHSLADVFPQGRTRGAPTTRRMQRDQSSGGILGFSNNKAC